MADTLASFEAIARRAHRYTDIDARAEASQHTFETQNIHEALPTVVRDLFDNGHYAQATFEAYKFLDKL